jgi:hypothetical protein
MIQLITLKLLHSLKKIDDLLLA